MKLYEINLVHKAASTCDFTIDRYPDGQVSATIPFVDPEGIYTIKSRMSSYEDLFIIAALNQILSDSGVSRRILYCPYILAGRSDAKFKTGQSFDLKLVTSFLNLCNFDEIQIIDPHSQVTPALINKSKVFSSFDAFITWIPYWMFPWDGKVLVSPDAGSYKKVQSIAEKLKIELIPGNKTRNKFNEPVTKFDGDVSGRDCVIIDDICDGGRTFVNLGKELKQLGAKTVTLIVTHGIFSNGLKLENIDTIFTTNSYKSFLETETSKEFEVIDIF